MEAFMERERISPGSMESTKTLSLLPRWNLSANPFISTFEIEPDPQDVMRSHHLHLDNRESNSTAFPLENHSTFLPVLLLLLCLHTVDFSCSKEVILLAQFRNIHYILSLLCAIPPEDSHFTESKASLTMVYPVACCPLPP